MEGAAAATETGRERGAEGEGDRLYDAQEIRDCMELLQRLGVAQTQLVAYRVSNEIKCPPKCVSSSIWSPYQRKGEHSSFRREVTNSWCTMWCRLCLPQVAQAKFIRNVCRYLAVRNMTKKYNKNALPCVCCVFLVLAWCFRAISASFFSLAFLPYKRLFMFLVSWVLFCLISRSTRSLNKFYKLSWAWACQTSRSANSSSQLWTSWPGRWHVSTMSCTQTLSKDFYWTCGPWLHRYCLSQSSLKLCVYDINHTYALRIRNTSTLKS